MSQIHWLLWWHGYFWRKAALCLLIVQLSIAQWQWLFYLISFIHYPLYHSGEIKLCYSNKTTVSQRLIFYSHKICSGLRHLSGDSCPLCVGGVMFCLISLNVVKRLYLMFSIFVQRQKVTPFLPFCFLFFFYLIARPHPHGLPWTPLQWKRKHREWKMAH